MQNYLTSSRSQRGETLVETLVAILIVGLASAALASMISTATHLNKTAKEKDQALFTAINSIYTSGSSTNNATLSVKIDNKPVSFTVTLMEASDGNTDGNTDGNADGNADSNANVKLKAYSYTQKGGAIS